MLLAKSILQHSLGALSWDCIVSWLANTIIRNISMTKVALCEAGKPIYMTDRKQKRKKKKVVKQFLFQTKCPCISSKCYEYVTVPSLIFP